jgi:hypothetical protein
MAESTYFAARNAKATAADVISKVNAWSNNLEANGYLDKLRTAWSAYHGAYYTDMATGHQITFGGMEGELVNFPVNHFRNLAQHVLVMTTSTRPTMEARSMNTDYKSLTQTLLANGLLDYYMREKRLEYYLKTAVEYAIVMGSGFIKMSWNSTSGEMYDFNEETETPIYEGDVEFTNLSPFDVVVDNSREDQNLDWIVSRVWKNRFDLAAKYPEIGDKLKSLPTKSEIHRYRFIGLGQNNTDDVAVFEFFHKRTEALPDGRYILFGSDDTIMYDGPLPYRNLPIFRIAPGEILGTPYGYSNMFDLIPMQEALNSLYSTVLSNQNAFGVQNILVPRGADIAFNQLTGGLNIIEANISAGKPEALQLTQTPAEIFNFINMIKSDMETISGVNSVARGNPEASLKSGAALALVQSMAIQFISGLQQSYVKMIEDVGTSLIMMLKDFAAVPRVAAIVGKNNRAFMKEFKGDDLSSISRIIVDVANPLARTTAGRVEMAQQLLQMGAIKDPQQYFTVMNTGRLEAMTEGIQSDLMLIKGENEMMMAGQTPQAVFSDDHRQHIQEHRAVLSDPDLRKDAGLVQNVLSHIQQHIQLLQQTDPNILMALGQQPIQTPPPPASQPNGPPMTAQGAPMPPGGPHPPNGGPGAQQGPNPGAPPNAGQAAPPIPGEAMPPMPKLPVPPAPFKHNDMGPIGNQH